MNTVYHADIKVPEHEEGDLPPCITTQPTTEVYLKLGPFLVHIIIIFRLLMKSLRMLNECLRIHLLPPSIFQYFLCCFVAGPVDWLVSFTVFRLASCELSFVPRPFRSGERRAWYPLFAHSSIFPRFGETGFFYCKLLGYWLKVLEHAYMYLAWVESGCMCKTVDTRPFSLRKGLGTRLAVSYIYAWIS